jgi:hypothetical protein
MLEFSNKLIAVQNDKADMKKTIKTLLLISVLILMTSVLFAQNTSQAVMQVRVEVVSGAQITQMTNQDISNQIVRDQNGKTDNGMINLGSFTLLTPDGVQFSARIEDSITFNANDENWFDILTKADRNQIETGKTEINITGMMTAGNIIKGQYSGKQIAVIEYY